ncbi:MAG: tetratricopeptide repeat protein [Flavobacteriales bacterium]
MKKVVLGVIALVAVQPALAQQDDINWENFSPECKRSYVLYNDYLRQKEYDESLKYWKEVVAECPKVKESLYSNGAFLYGDVIGRTTDEKRKETLIDSLVWVYERGMELFGETPEMLSKYGNDLMRYRPKIHYEKAHNSLKKAITANQEKSSPGDVQYYFLSTDIMVKAKKKQAEFLIDEYLMLSDVNDVNIKNDNLAQYYKGAQDFLDRVAAPYLDCGKLEEIAKSQYEKNKEDDATNNKLLNLLGSKGCTEGVYVAIAENMHKKSPTHATAYNLGVMYANKKKYNEAFKYFDEALSLCGDCPELSKYLDMAAQTSSASGRHSTAVNYAKRMINSGINRGEAYLIIAKAIAASANDCGENDTQRRLTYSLAMDYCDKAKSADGSVSSKANALYNAYKSNLPSKGDAFTFGYKEGESYKVGCWINETTTVRTRD